MEKYIFQVKYEMCVHAGVSYGGWAKSSSYCENLKREKKEFIC